MAGPPRLIDSSDGSWPAANAPSAWLVDARGLRHPLGPVASVGRAEGNDVRIPSPAVSRFHALLRQSAGRWSVTDLDSRNGTRVNDELIAAPRALYPNDRVQFGDTIFTFVTAAERGETRPSRIDFSILSHTTPHFRLLFQADSFAASQREIIEERLEQTDRVLAEIFGLPTERPLVSVYLLDEVSNPNQSDEMLGSGGYAEPRFNTIYEVYRPDAPGVQLERSVVVLALETALADRQASAGSAASLNANLREGLSLFVLNRARTEPADEEDRWTPVAEAMQQGSLPSLRALLTGGPTEPPLVGQLAVAHLLGYLADRHGAGAVGTFVRALAAGDLDGAARSAAAKPLGALEKAWRKQLRATTLSGLQLFFSLLVPYLRPYRLKMAEIGLYVTLSAAFGVVLARATGFLIDRALLPRDYGAFRLIMGGLIAAFIIVSLTSLRENYVKAWVSERILRDLRLGMFGRIQSLHHGYFARHDSGDLMSRLTSDLFMVESALTSGVIESIRLVLMMALALAMIFFTEWKLAFVVVVGAPIFFVISRYLGRPVARASFDRQNQMGEVSNEIHENLAAQPVIKLFGLQRLMLDRFTSKVERLFQTSLRLHFLGGLYGIVSNSAASFIELSVLGAGAYLVLEGRASTGTLFTFILLVGQIVMPMQSMSSLFQFVQQGTGSMKRVNDLISAQPAIADAPDARPLTRLSRDIRLEHIAFSYDATRPILQNVSLSIPAGTNVALVGPSGSGKSTVLNLIARFYDPQHGRVLFDGVDLRQASLESLRGQIGMVFQESVLFDASIRENIRLGHPEASDAEVEAAARAAELHDFIQELPEGYDTVVGERGGLLSGGQRQRVAIARAIIRNPALLLLDEATSALDPATEAAINGTLRRLASGRTTVSVTHRLSSVVHADQIFVLQAGQLAEQGTHAELLQRDGLYARLWQEQQGGAGLVAPAGIDLDSLRRVPLFAQLDQGLLTQLATSLVQEQFAPGTAIVKAGEVGDRLYLIDSGEVDVLSDGATGIERRLAVLGAGDFFGEIALLRDVPRTATVRARTTVDALSLSQENFLALLAGSPRLREVVMQTATQREQQLREVAGRSHAPATPASGVAPA